MKLPCPYLATLIAVLCMTAFSACSERVTWDPIKVGQHYRVGVDYTVQEIAGQWLKVQDNWGNVFWFNTAQASTIKKID